MQAPLGVGSPTAAARAKRLGGNDLPPSPIPQRAESTPPVATSMDTSPMKSRLSAASPTFGVVKNHESFLLAKRTSGSRTVYNTDATSPTRGMLTPIPAEKWPYTKANPAPASRADLPQPRKFIGRSMASTAGETVLKDTENVDGHFYSRLSLQAVEEQRKNFNSSRHEEGRRNAKKGHGGNGFMGSKDGRESGEKGHTQLSYTDAAGMETSLRGHPRAFHNHGPPSMQHSGCSVASMDVSHKARLQDRSRLGGMPMVSSYNTEFQGGKLGDLTDASPAKGTTQDLQAGTAKGLSDYRVVGYLGHTPASENNSSKVANSVNSGYVRDRSKESLLLTMTKDMPGYSGYCPKELENDRGILHPELDKTSTGTSGLQGISEPEVQRMNERNFSKSHAMKTLFSRGHGGEDLVIAETFYTKYRPYEGGMKHGPTSDQSWISDVQLRRTQN